MAVLQSSGLFLQQQGVTNTAVAIVEMKPVQHNIKNKCKERHFTRSVR